ncbi:MAG: ABC transporter permease, partial [Actinomyces sp.]
MPAPTSATAEAAPVSETVLEVASQKTSLWRQLGLLIQWQFRRSLPVLPLFIIVQTLLSVSMVLGYGLIAGHPGREASLHLAGGGPAIAL